MKTLNLIQGTPEWIAHRSQHLNASDAPAMMGVSPLKSRRELLQEIHSGVAPEFSDYVQQHIIDPGHAFEDRARGLAEEIIGEELYPCVGVSDDGRYSASFDGLTLTGEVAFEHKRLNAELRDAMIEGCTGEDLPALYRVQLEQQCMVSGAQNVLFMASEWEGSTLVEERHCWYRPNMDLRRRIGLGWDQLQADLAIYVPETPAAPKAVGQAPEKLPALRIELTGMVTESNLAEFKEQAIEVFRGISTDLRSDQDFADAAETVRWCSEIETRLEAAKQHALSQTKSIDELFRAIDEISGEARSKRLQLDKLVTKRKEEVRGEIVQRGYSAIQAHYTALNAGLGEHALSLPNTLRNDLAQAIKGKRSVTSMNDAVDSTIAAEKIEASETAERVRACIAVLAKDAVGFETLFADSRNLCASKSPEDLRNLVLTRIADHKQAEAAKAEAERARQLEAAHQELQHQQDTPKGEDARAAAEPVMQPANPAPLMASAAPMLAGARIKLGDINGWIAPMTITAAGLSSLGFQPVGKQGAAQLYFAGSFPAICAALIQTLHDAPARAKEKQAA